MSMADLILILDMCSLFNANGTSFFTDFSGSNWVKIPDPSTILIHNAVVNCKQFADKALV